MKKWLWLALFGCGVANADMLDALQAYEKQQFAEAKREFEQLLPLGNELAAFNLGAMAYQGEGQQPDLTKAIAYFMLAAELQHNNAQGILQKLLSQATEQQLAEAKLQLDELKGNIIVTIGDNDFSERVKVPEPIKRSPPTFPRVAARDGIFGYVNLRFLVDESGNVTAIDALDAYPEGVFEKSAIRAVKNWKYESSTEKHLLKVQMDFSLSGGVKVSAVEKIVEEHNLWQYALMGSPQHQLALGTLLSMISIQSGVTFNFDKNLPLATTPDFSIFEPHKKITADFKGFLGSAVVRVDEKGVITEQHNAQFDTESAIKQLVGLTLKGKLKHDTYRVFSNAELTAKRIWVTPELTLDRSMSGQFWWEQAAKNGNVEAQRIMASVNSSWERYLLNKKDAEVMAWTGTRLILEGQREQGMLLLDQAIAQNYQPAKEMKQQFM